MPSFKHSANYLDLFRHNGHATATIREQVVLYAQTHPDMADIDAYATHLIKQAGGEPAFSRVPGYQWTTCISINDVIVHGIPNGQLKPGDLVTIDLGMYYQGTTTDCATTFYLGNPPDKIAQFLHIGQKALHKAITQAKAGNQIKLLSEAMQDTARKAGYEVARSLTGHGLGDTLHEPPTIPCFVSSDPVLKRRLKEGMVVAIEIMYMIGEWSLVTDSDGWAMRTRDGSLSAQFEEDVIITSQGPEIITTSSKSKITNKNHLGVTLESHDNV